MTEKLCRLTCYKSQCTRVDKESKYHILTPSASPSAACVILTPQHHWGSWSSPPPCSCIQACNVSFNVSLKDISFIEEIILIANRGRGFPVVKIWGRTCNEWWWDLQAEDFLHQPSIPHLSETWQLLQFRRVRIYTLWDGALISLFCYSANHFPCISF